MRRATIERTGAPPVEWIVPDTPPGVVPIALGQVCNTCRRRYEHAPGCDNHYDLGSAPYPHNHLRRLGYPPLDRWRCVPCGAEGTFDALRGMDCTVDYPSCDDCGCTPECAPDCEGMARALTMPGVHVAGSGPDGGLTSSPNPVDSTAT